MRIGSFGTIPLTAIAAALAISSSGSRAQTQSPAQTQSSSQTQTPAAASAPARDNASAASRVGTARIRGRVVNTDGAPLRRAEVRLTSLATGTNPREIPLLATDEQGYYEFRTLGAGRYTLEASKSGYMTMAYGQRRPFELARPVEIGDGQLLEGIDIGLPRGGAIVARVTDASGDPMSGVFVQALQYRVPGAEMQYRFSGSARRLIAMASSIVVPGSVVTNDLGLQRIYDLPPGDYYVAVRSTTLGPADNGRLYAPTYYPGTTSFGEAQRVTLGVGQEVSVSFPLVPLRSFSISGSVHNASGGLFARPSVVLVDASATTNGSGRPATIQSDGSFTFSGVFSGEYVITVVGGLLDPNAVPEFVKMPVTVVNRDITSLALATNYGSTMHGRIVFDTGTPPANLRAGAVQFAIGFPAGSCNAGRTAWNADWTFDTRGINCDAAQLSLNAATAPGWFLKGFMLDGKDVSDGPLDFSNGREIKDLQVVLTRTRTDVSGGAVDAGGSAASDYVAVFFAEDRALWTSISRFIATGRPDQKGQFRIAGLPPGRYLGVALDYLPSGEERDPELLARLKDRAAEVTLEEGESKSVTLRVVPY